MRVLDPENRPLATSDGWICVTSNTDVQAKAFLRAIDRAELIDDPRFCNVLARFKNARDWFALRADALKQKTTAHWLAVLTAADVPAMICHTLETLLTDEHLTAVGLLQVEEHPQEGPITTIRPSILLDDAPISPGPPAEPLGWSTTAVLTEAGLSPATLSTLLAERGAVDGRAPKSAA